MILKPHFTYANSFTQIHEPHEVRDRYGKNAALGPSFVNIGGLLLIPGVRPERIH